jgi:hypothetical protein
MAKSKPIEVDILDMEMSQDLTYWLDPIQKYDSDARQAARRQSQIDHVEAMQAEQRKTRPEARKKKRWQRIKARAETLLARGQGDVTTLVKIAERAEARLVKGQNGLYKVWNEDDHPRAPAGGPDGGEFVGGGGGSEDSGKPVPGGQGAGAGGDGQPSRTFSRESPSGAQSGRDVVAIWRSETGGTFYEHGGSGGAKAFHSAITRAKSGEFGASVHVHEPDEYKGMRLFTAPDGKSGFALDGDNIVSLFKDPDVTKRGVAAASLKLAVEQGGRRLDCFDTALPSLYARSGFKAVARLKWNETYKPDGWDKATYKDYNKGEPDVVFMTYNGPAKLSYTAGDGRTVKDYDEGTAEQLKSAPSVAGYNPGTRGRGDVEVKAKRTEWVAASNIKTIDDVIRAAPIAQKNFADAASRIAKEMGIEFKDPGPKTSSAKGIARTEQKIAERDGLTARVTDTARGAFILNSPDQADAVIQKLGRTHEVLAEPWRTIPDSLYTDRALLFRDRATGLIGEVQITEPKMVAAKKIGHPLYEQARTMPKGPERDALEVKQREIYGAVLDGYKGTDWAIVDGRSRLGL